MTWLCRAFPLQRLRRGEFESNSTTALQQGIDMKSVVPEASLARQPWQRARRGHPVGRVGVDQVSDVLVLLKKNMVSVARDVYVKQVAYWAFIFDVPTRRQVRRERLVERSDPVIGVQCEEVIDVAPDDQALESAVDLALGCEHAGVR
eukprot:1772663-Pleurochrysis_carterae.AAC.1